MITIPEAVQQIISRSPFLEESLGMGIMNISALARLIKPEIESILFKGVQEGAIMMALKRLTVKNYTKSRPKKLFSQTPDLIIRSNLVEFTVANSDRIVKQCERLLESLNETMRYFFTITQGIFETAIIVSEELSPKVEELIRGERVIDKTGGLSSITIKLPKENVVTPGVYYIILKALAWERVNIIDVVSTHSEFTLIINNKEVDRAFTLLKKTLTN